MKPHVRIIGVQAAGAAAMVRSLSADRLVVLDRTETMADGIALRSPSALTLAHCRELVDDVVTVSDAVRQALACCSTECRSSSPSRTVST